MPTRANAYIEHINCLLVDFVCENPYDLNYYTKLNSFSTIERSCRTMKATENKNVKNET